MANATFHKHYAGLGFTLQTFPNGSTRMVNSEPGKNFGRPVKKASRVGKKWMNKNGHRNNPHKK